MGGCSTIASKSRREDVSMRQKSHNHQGCKCVYDLREQKSADFLESNPGAQLPRSDVFCPLGNEFPRLEYEVEKAFVLG